MNLDTLLREVSEDTEIMIKEWHSGEPLETDIIFMGYTGGKDIADIDTSSYSVDSISVNADCLIVVVSENEFADREALELVK